MNLIVCLALGDIIQVTCEETDNVLHLKNLVWKPPESPGDLYFKGKKLQDDAELQSLGIKDGDELLTTLDGEVEKKPKKKGKPPKRIIQVSVENNFENQCSLLSWYDDAHQETHKRKLSFSGKIRSLVQGLSKDLKKKKRYKGGVAKRGNATIMGAGLVLGHNLALAKRVEFREVVFELHVPEEI